MENKKQRPKNWIDFSDIEEQILLLKKGKLVIYPTDTIWGIGCDATNEEACLNLIKLKRRDASKSFVILVDSFRMLEKYIPAFHEVCYELIDCSEKPLTIIYPNGKGFAPSVVAEDGSVAIRITSDPLCKHLIKTLRRPIVSTSANYTGEPFPTSFQQIDPQLLKEVDGVIAKRTQEKMEKASQIIKIELDGTVQIIRS
jgi:L-threonylcarbamoyladenylate synthase